jgi:hypothetical protein
MIFSRLASIDRTFRKFLRFPGCFITELELGNMGNIKMLLANKPDKHGVFEEKSGDDEFGEPERHYPFSKGNFHVKILS